jgi:hypothetical protein
MQFKNQKLWLLYLAIPSFLLFTITACKKTDSNFNGRISFLNGIIDSEPITVKLNDNELISKDSFGVLKPNIIAPSGTFKVGFYIGTSTTPSYSITTNIESGRDYTWFVYDSAQQGKVFLNKDFLPEKVTEGKCAIRFFSLIPNSNSLFLQNDTGKTFLSNKTFASYPNTFEEADTTSLLLKMKMSGTVAALDSLKKPLTDGKIYTIFLTGSIGGTGVQKPKMIFLEHN